MNSMIKNKKLAKYSMIFFIVILFIKSVIAHEETVDIDKIQLFGISLHLIEVLLSIFICFMAIRFFRITRPLNLFLIVYVAVGFFAINSLLYILFYTLHLRSIHISFVSVYLGSRVSLIAMMVSLGALFYYLNKQMRKKYKV